MADGLDLKLLQKFNAQLDKTYETLIKLDDELKKFEKLTTVDVKTGPGLRATARALDELARSMSRFSGTTKGTINKAGQNLVDFIEQIDRATALVDNDKAANLAKFLRQVAGALNEVKELQKGIRKASVVNANEFVTKVISPLFNAIRHILDQSSQITPARMAGLSDNLRAVGGLFRVVIDIANQVQNLKSDTLDPKLFKALKPFIEAVLTLMQASEKITPQRLARSALAFESIGVLFRQIGVVIESLAPIKGASALSQFLKLDPVSKFVQLTAVVRSMLYLAQSLSSTKLGSLAETFKGLEGLFRGLGDIINLMSDLSKKFKFPTTLLRQILVFERIIAPIIKVTKAIADATRTGGADGLAAFESMVRGLSGAISILSSLQNKFTGLTNLFRQLQILDRVAGRLVKIFRGFAEASQGVNPVVFEGIGTLVKALAKTLRILLDLQIQFAQLGSFIRSADILERAGGRLKNIFAKFADIKIKPGVFEGLSKFVPAFLSFFRELSFIQSDRGSFKDIGKSIEPLENASKRLGKIFQNIAEGFSKLGIAKESLKDIATILVALEKLDAVQEKIAKLKESAADSGAASIGVFARLKDVISAAVTEGILRANLLLKVFGVLKKVVLEVAKVFLKFVFPPFVVASNLKALAQIGNALREIGDNIRDVGEQMRDFGLQFLQNFGIGALFQSAAVQAAVGFDALSDQVRVFGNLTEEGVQQAEELAFVIGQKYPLSANDALKAILDLTKAGQDLSSTEFILPAAANLTALSESGDLNTVIEGLIAAEGAFTNFRNAAEGIPAIEGTFENIAVATDIIAAGANVSTASVESLTAGLANVGTAANSFGLSLEETVAVLSIFEDAGLKAAEGGTALRSLLNALDRPQTATALRNLGVALFDPETGARRPLNDVITDISAALEGMPEAQKVAVLQQLSDTFGRQGLSILLAEGADGIDTVVDSMNALPTAAEQAQQLLDNLAGDILQLQGSVETFMLRAALPMIERFFRPFVQIARIAVDSLLTLDEGFFEFLGTAIALSASLATLIGAFLVVTGAILQVGGVVFIAVGALLNLQFVLGSILAFGGAFLTGILAITAAFIIFVPLIIAITSAFETLFQVFSTNAGGATSAAQAFFGTIIGTARTVFDFIGSLLNLFSVFTQRTDATEGSLESLGATFAGMFANLSRVFTGGFIGDLRSALSQLTQIFDVFSSFDATNRQIGELSTQLFGLGLANDTLDNSLAQSDLEARIAALQDSFRQAVAGLVQNVPLFRNAVQNMFGDTSDASVNAFVDSLFETFDNIGIGLNQAKDAFTNFFGDLAGGTGIGEALQGLVHNIDQGLGQAFYNILVLFKRFFGGNEILDRLMESFQSGEGLSAFGAELIEVIVDSIRNAIIDNRGTLKDLFLGLVDSFFGLLRNLRFITDLLGAGPISDLFESFEGVLRDLLGGVFDTLINLIAGQDLRTALENAFGDSIDPLFTFIDTVTDIFGSIQRIFTNIFDFFFGGGLGEAANAIGDFFNFDGLVQGIQGFAEAIAGFFDLLALGDTGVILQRIQEFFGGIFTSGVDFITEILPDIGSFLSTFFANLGQAFKDYLISIGVPPEFIAFGEDVFNAVVAGVSGAFANASSTLSAAIADPVGFFTTVRDQLVTFITTDGPALFASVGTNLRDTVIGAVSSAFAGIEDALNIDFQPAIDTISESLTALFDAIQALLFGDEATGEATLIEDIITLIERITSAIVGLFNAFPKDNDGKNERLQFVVDFAADLAAIGIDAITDFVIALDDLLSFLTNADPEAIAALGAAVAIFAGPTVLGALATALGLVTAAFSTLLTTVFTVVIPFVALFIVIRALLQNVDELLQVFTELGEGDFGGALTQLGDALLNIFADITEQVGPLINLLLGFFGLGPLNFDSNSVVALGRALFDIFTEGGRALAIAFERIRDDFSANVTLWARQIADALVPGDDTELARITDFFATDNFSLDSLQGLNTSLTTQADIDLAQANAVLDQEAISKQVRDQVATAIANGDPVPVAISDIITLSELEVLTRTIDDAIFSGDVDVASAFLSLDALNPEDVRRAVNNILFAVQQGLLSAEDAQRLLLDLEIDPQFVDQAAAVNPIVDAAQAELQAQVDTAAPAQVDVPVDLVPNVGSFGTDGGTPAETLGPLEAEAERQRLAAQGYLDSQPAYNLEAAYRLDFVPAGAEQVAAEGEAPVAASLDIAGASAEDVSTLTADLQNLQTYAALVKIDLDALLPVLVQLGVDLTATQVAFDANNASMLIYLTQLTGMNLQFSLMSVNLLLLNLGTILLSLAFVNLGAVASTALNLINSGFQIFYNQLVVLLTTMTQGFAIVIKSAQNLSKVLGDVIARAQNIAAVVAAANAGAGGEPEVGDGNAQGGTTQAGVQSPIIEGGPEVYEEDGRFYLISNKDGYVMPLRTSLSSVRNSASSGMYPNASPAGAGAGAGASINNVAFGDTNIDVTIDGSTGDVQAIARAVGEAVTNAMQTQQDNVRRTLRKNHR